MAYNEFFNADIGTTGLTLKAALQDSSGTIHASLRDLACTEIGQGFYRITIAVPDSYIGTVAFYTGTLGVSANFSGVVLLATTTVQPNEYENLDVKVSSLGGMGTGPFSITTTVTDGTDPIQLVTVAIYDGNTLAGRLVTDVNGQATFSLAAGTYTATTYKAGYTSAPATGRTVTGNETGTLTSDLTMTATGSITPPANPDLCLLYGTILLTSGEPAVNVEVQATLVVNRPGQASGNMIAEQTVSAQTDVNGAFELPLIRTDVVDPSATYKIRCTPAGIQLRNIELTTSTQDLAALLPS